MNCIQCRNSRILIERVVFELLVVLRLSGEEIVGEGFRVAPLHRGK